MRLRFGYGFESCDANGPRNVKSTYLAKHRPVFLPPLLLLFVGSKELVLKVRKRRQFHAAIRVTFWRCDSCAQVALGRRTVSRRNFWDAESLAKRCGETCHYGPHSRMTPLAQRRVGCFVYDRGGSRRAFRLPGAGGDHSHCTVEPSPGHIRCRISRDFPLSTSALGRRYCNYSALYACFGNR